MCLLKIGEYMDIKKIKNANTKLLGKNIIYYDEIGSTQDEAKKLIKSGLENGTIFLANSQVKGHTQSFLLG